MLTNIFESRNKTFLNLVKLGDYLGRSLRENVEIFSVDNNEVTYLTESGYVVKGTFNKNASELKDIEIQDSGIFEDRKVYDQLTNKKVSNLLADILENDLSNAKKSFDTILSLWETKLKFERTKERIVNKAARFDESFKITSSPEFQRVVELKSELIKLLKENADYVKIPEIRSTIKLSSVISKSFNLPKITLDNLHESSEFKIPSSISHTLYDHLCKQELIAKELVESKDNLDVMWMTNEKVQKLPSYLFESDENIMYLVAEIVSEVPYFAMATKKQISSLIEGNLDLVSESIKITNGDVKNLVSKIFEFKKPVRTYINTILNEKYGINIQTLTSAPTFDSLVKAQSIIFESLSKLSPKNSNLRRTLSEFASSLKDKGGVEAIDVSDFLNEVFSQCEYDSSINETSLMNYLNFDKVADDLGKIGQVLKMIQAGVGGGAMPGVQGGGQPEGMAQEMPEEGGEGEYESDGGDDTAGMEGMEDEEEEDMPFQDDEQNPSAAMDAEDAADEVRSEEEGGEEGMPEEEGDMPPEEGEGEEEEVEFTERDDLIDNMKELEELIASLKGDLGVGEDDGGSEGEEDGIEIDTGEGDDEVHIDSDSHNDEEEEEGEDEESDEEEEDYEEEDEEKPEED